MTALSNERQRNEALTINYSLNRFESPRFSTTENTATARSRTTFEPSQADREEACQWSDGSARSVAKCSEGLSDPYLPRGNRRD